MAGLWTAVDGVLDRSKLWMKRLDRFKRVNKQ